MAEEVAEKIEMIPVRYFLDTFFRHYTRARGESNTRGLKSPQFNPEFFTCYMRGKRISRGICASDKRKEFPDTIKRAKGTITYDGQNRNEIFETGQDKRVLSHLFLYWQTMYKRFIALRQSRHKKIEYFLSLVYSDDVPLCPGEAKFEGRKS